MVPGDGLEDLLHLGLRPLDLRLLAQPVRHRRSGMEGLQQVQGAGLGDVGPVQGQLTRHRQQRGLLLPGDVRPRLALRALQPGPGKGPAAAAASGRQRVIDRPLKLLGASHAQAPGLGASWPGRIGPRLKSSGETRIGSGYSGGTW